MDLVSLAPDHGPSTSHSITAPLLVKMACKQNLVLRCVLISDPGTLGAGAKTRLHTPKAVTYHEQAHYCRFMMGHSLMRMESRIKKFTPHCVCIAGRVYHHRQGRDRLGYSPGGGYWYGAFVPPISCPLKPHFLFYGGVSIIRWVIPYKCRNILEMLFELMTLCNITRSSK